MANIGAIPTGVSVIIDPSVTGVQTGNTFLFQPGADDADYSVLFQATGTLTGLSSDLQVSLDGGTTFQNITNGTAFLTAAAPNKVLTPAIAGCLFRFNHTASTGNAVIRAVAN